MAKELSTSIDINASPAKVWAVLTDFENYPNWNPFIKSLQGNARVGSTLTAVIAPPDAKEMTFKPKVLVFEQNKEFKWQGHLFFKGLFDGAHKFELIDLGNGTTRLVHSEKFGGILVPLMAKQLDINIKKGFEMMNAKLKELAEQK